MSHLSFRMPHRSTQSTVLALAIVLTSGWTVRASDLILSEFGYSTFGDGTMSTFSTNAGGNPSAPANPFPFAGIPSLGGAPLIAGGIAQDGAGNLYVSNIGFLSTGSGDPNVYEFSGSGAYKGIFATLPNLTGQDNASSLAFHNGSLYVADFGGTTVEKFSSTGQDQGTATNIGDQPGGIAFNHNGTLFVTGLNTGDVFQIAGNGTPSVFVNGGTNGIVFPEGLAFDNANNLYLANTKDGVNSAIDKFNSSGTFQAEYGTPLASPSGMLLSKDGNSILIAANGTNEFGPTGGLLQLQISTGSVTQIGGSLVAPTGLVYALSVPEPASWSLAVIAGVACLAGARRSRARRNG